MSYKKLTTGVVIGASVLLSLYDIWVDVHGGTPATISAVLLQAAHAHPAIPLAWGLLTGHLFASQE